MSSASSPDPDPRLVRLSEARVVGFVSALTWITSAGCGLIGHMPCPWARPAADEDSGAPARSSHEAASESSASRAPGSAEGRRQNSDSRSGSTSC